MKKELEESCERAGTFGVGEWESWIDDDLVGSANLDTCKEICNRDGKTCQSGSIEEFFDDGRDSGAVVIACNTPFGVEKPSRASVSCICCS